MAKAATARKPRIEMRTSERPRSPKGGGGKKKLAPKAPKGSWGARLRSFVLRATVSVGFGAAVGGGLVGATLYRQALDVVDHGALHPAWSVPGHVWSAPIEVWPGLHLTPTQLAADLADAGYTRVAKATQPGDLQLSDDAVLLVPRKQSGPGFDVKGGPVLVRFDGGAVASISPGNKLTVGPEVLATVRGEDNENRNPVALDRIPKTVRDAVIAMEDSRFYDHAGVDPIGLTRALVVNATHKGSMQGGSTLTQQLAKNLFLDQERTWERKYKEAFLALALEHRLGKDEILARYLNEIYLGQIGGASVCGMDAAARGYFGKPVERVSLGEAATLAGIISSPNAYSPVKHPERAKERRDLALGRMVDVGFVSQAEADAARAEPLEVHADAGGRSSPWAVDLALDSVEGAQDGLVGQKGLDVYTSIQPALQRLAEDSVHQGYQDLVAAHKDLKGVELALVAVRARDGAVVAMVGSRDYGHSPFNRAASAERRIGSTVKPLTLLAAFEADPDLSPATVLDDAPLSREHDGKTWTPSNYDGTYVGPISIRRAIATSRNIPAVLLAEKVGMPELKKRFRSLGLVEATDYPSAALGGFAATPLQLAGAYSVFAAGGAYHVPWLVRGVRTHDGDTVADTPPPKATTTWSARATFLTRDVLRSVMTDGTGKGAAKYGVGPGAVGKTGTTDDYVDAWFAGVSGPYAVVVWVGFDKDKKVGLTGGEAALPTWARFVAATGTSGATEKAPTDLVKAEICDATGTPACADCTTTHEEWFAAGHVPKQDCSVVPEATKAVTTGIQKLEALLGAGK